MLPIQKKYVNYNYSKRNSKPKYIIWHDTGNAGASANNHYKYFNSGDKGASADFFVDSDNIIQIINTDVNYSWAVGDGKGAYGITNANSCSIELCLEPNGYPSETTINNAIELTRYLMSYYGISIDGVKRHYDASRKSCPDSLKANNWAKWNEIKSRISIQPKPQWKQNSTGWWYDLGDGSYPINKWMEIKGEWYYFDEKGYAYCEKWLKYKDIWYWFDKDCKMVKNCVLQIKGKYYAFDSEGRMMTEDVKIDNNGALKLD